MVNVVVNEIVGVPLVIILTIGGGIELVFSLLMPSLVLFLTGAMMLAIGVMLQRVVPMSTIPWIVFPQTTVDRLKPATFTLAGFIAFIVVVHSLVLLFFPSTDEEDNATTWMFHHAIVFLLMLLTTLLVAFGAGVNPYPPRKEVFAYVLSNGSLSLTPPKKV
jgi:hypothetical protein